MRGKSLALLLVLFDLTALAGCAALFPTPTPTPAPTETATPSPSPTWTPSPTDTATPTATATATATSTPTATPTRRPTRIPVTRTPTVETTPGTAEATSATGPTATSAGGTGFAPTVATVWQLDYSATSTSKTAACGPDMTVDFYGLVAVAPVEGGLTWKRQDGIVYTLQKTGPNSFAGGGASSLPGFTLGVAVTFLSPTTLVVTYTLTPTDNTDCKYKWKYNGTFAWNS